jgi:hypothetical protein
METSLAKEKLIAGYWALLSGLDLEIRMELITRLVNSLKEELPSPAHSDWKKLFGAWEADEEPEDLVREIRNARLFIRKQVEL